MLWESSRYLSGEVLWREREMPINHLLKTCKWEAFRRLQLHWEANTSKTMKDNKKGYFEPLNFGVVNYPALDNQNRETFYPSLSEESGYFWFSRIVYFYFHSQMLRSETDIIRVLLRFLEDQRTLWKWLLLIWILIFLYLTLPYLSVQNCSESTFPFLWQGTSIQAECVLHCPEETLGQVGRTQKLAERRE